MTSTIAMTPEQRAAFEAWQRTQPGYVQPQVQQLPSSLDPRWQQQQPQAQWQGNPQGQPQAQWQGQPQQQTMPTAGPAQQWQQTAPQPSQPQYPNPGQQWQQPQQPQQQWQGNPQGNPQQGQQQWQGQPQQQQQWGAPPAMDQGAIIAQMRRDMQGIGAQSLAAERLVPPAPAKVVRDMSLPPERNITSSFESTSLVRLTNGKVRQTTPKPGEYSKTFYQVQGMLVATTGDTPVNSEVGFSAWPGLFYKRDMKGIIVAVCQLRGADASNEDLIMSKIEEIFIRSPSTAAGKMIGCKCYIGVSKAGKQGLRWTTFPVAQAPDGSWQPLI